MSKDCCYTYVHLSSPRHADLFDEFTRSRLNPEDIYVPSQYQPPNPEDEDDVVPDQHAAFGIQRATQARREPAWRDLGLNEMAPDEGPTNSANTAAAGPGPAAGGSGTASGSVGGQIGHRFGMAPRRPAGSRTGTRTLPR